MKYIIALLFCLGLESVLAQTPQTPPAQPTTLQAPDPTKATLDQRFQYMRAKAESYQDYKVIKAVTLDAEWKIVVDSVKANKAKWQEMKRSIDARQAELKVAQQNLQEKEASMSDIIYQSEHITFLGISFAKSTFIVLFLIVLVGLLVVAGLLAGRLQMVHSSAKEKTDLAESTLKEFEEYKHKALEKQAKLSRELQNERNKLAERHN